MKHSNAGAQALCDPSGTCASTRGRPARRGARAAHRSVRRLAGWASLLLVLALAAAPAPGADPEPARTTGTGMPGLDEQVQDVKSDVLAIAAELAGLEERLLYPSGTQVSLFVSLAEGESLSLDSVSLSIDGEPVARHVYSFKEVEALAKGGVQRIYTGNLRTGSHRVEVVFQGRRAGGADFETSEAFTLDKQAEPKLVGLTIASGLAGKATIAVEDW